MNTSLRTDKAVTRANVFLLAIVGFCVFSFKIILLPIGEGGIRVDDVLICLTFIGLLATGQLRAVRLSKACKSYCLFLCVGIVSALWNGMEGRVGATYSLVFVARQFEYIAFFYFGYLLKGRSPQLSRMFVTYFAVLVVVVPAQMMGVIPVPGAFPAERASGNTNGPYELAAVAGFLLCYLGYAQGKKVSGAVAFLFVVLSAARITFVGAALTLIRVLLRKTKRRIYALGVVFMLGVCCLGLTSLLPHLLESPAANESSVMLVSRLGGSSLPLEDVKDIYDTVPIYRTADAYMADMFEESIDLALTGSGDASGMVRVYRWTTLLKSTLNSIDAIALGLGPSFGSVAVDGYYVRAFVETGIVGLFVFILFLRTLYRSTPPSHWPFREYIVILMISALFIDVFTAYKPMMLLWLWHGLNQSPLAGEGR